MIRQLGILIVLGLFHISAQAATGVLVIAHGSYHGGHDHHHHGCTEHRQAQWERQVLATTDQVQKNLQVPIEVAFGMWDTPCYEAAITRLQNRLSGQSLDELVVIPYFISNHSSVIEMQKYIFHERNAKPIPIDVDTINFGGLIKFGSAMDYHSIVAAIVKARAQKLLARANVASPDQADLYFVMHGPEDDATMGFWQDLGQLYVNSLNNLGFNKQHVIILRDDAEDTIRDAVTKDFRDQINLTTQGGRKSLILPFLISSGGIDAGIIDRLKGLSYVWTGEALSPDNNLADYLLMRIKEKL